MDPRKEELFEKVFREQGERIFAWVLRRCGNRQLSEDITSECFIRTFERYDGEESDLTKILYRIADNLLSDHFRAKCRDERYSVTIRKQSIEAGECTPESEAVMHEEQHSAAATVHRVREILSCSDRLKESHRKCLSMRLFENKTPKEIARELPADYIQVKNLLQYGLRILKEELGLSTSGKK